MEPSTAAPAQQAPNPQQQIMLPVLVFGTSEVRRLLREIEALDEYLAQAAIREPGRQMALPRLSRMCEGLATENGLNLLQQADRTRLQQFLKALQTTAPVVHISFAADPSSAFMSRIVTWFRTSVHPYTLVSLGLQPTIAAGCIVRTTNKIFDCSLRQHFAKQEALLVQAFDTEAAQAVAAVVATASVAVAPVVTPAPSGVVS